MRCPACNTNDRDDAVYCLHCGSSLVPVCLRCGWELPPRAQFCDGCGTHRGDPTPATVGWRDTAAAEALRRLAPTAYADRQLAASGKMVGERRLMTILMSDVKGSGAMSRDLEPEERLEIMGGAFEVRIEPIARYGCTVARLEGDAFLALFGVPIAHWDDPERACRAELEIIEGARAWAVRLEQERGIRSFAVRVGIHTGLVVVGEVDTDLQMEYTAIRQAPNLTARLEGAAEPGTVLISEATHQFIAPHFELEPLAPIQAKGWQEPVPVWRVLAARDIS